MARFLSEAAKGTLSTPNPGFAGVAVTHRYTINVPTTVAVGDVLEIACIPPGCRAADIVVDSDKLDSNGSPVIAFDVGVMSGGWGDPDPARTIGAEFFAASNVAQAGGVARPTIASAYRVSHAAAARSVGVKITTRAATAVAGSIGITLTVVA